MGIGLIRPPDKQAHEVVREIALKTSSRIACANGHKFRWLAVPQELFLSSSVLPELLIQVKTLLIRSLVHHISLKFPWQSKKL